MIDRYEFISLLLKWRVKRKCKIDFRKKFKFFEPGKKTYSRKSHLAVANSDHLRIIENFDRLSNFADIMKGFTLTHKNNTWP